MTTPRPVPPLTRTGLVLGARAMLPVLPGIVVFAGAFGTLAAQKGLTLGETLLMSGLVFAGAAQFVAVEMWTDRWSLAALAAVAFVTFTVNLRMVLMGAALRPWLAPLPARRVYPILFFNTDSNWIAAMRYRAEGGSDVGLFLGSGLMLWVVWVGATGPGYLLGALVRDPKAFALDLVLPVFFCAMVVPLWKGRTELIGWGVAAAVALAAQALIPGWWFVVIGALAGAVAGGLMRDD